MIRNPLYAVASSLFLEFASGSIALAQEQSIGDGSENQCEALADSLYMASVEQQPETISQDHASRASDLLFVQLRQVVKADAKLTDQEMTNQERDIWRYHHDGGSHLRMRKAAQLAGRSPCQGQCFAAVLEFVQEARVAGANHQIAMTMSIRALQDENREYRRAPTPLDKSHLVAGLRTRLHTRLMDWQRDQQKARVKGLTRTKSKGAAQARGEVANAL